MRIWRSTAAVLAVFAFALAGCSSDSDVPPSNAAGAPGCEPHTPVELDIEVVRRLPHDTSAYTQGLVVRDDEVLEGTGLVGESTLRTLDLNTGEETARSELPPEVFGEGVALVEGDIVQLTWKDGVAYRWNDAGTEVLEEFSYDGEGWGLTTLPDATLAMSDGTDMIQLRDPETFEVLSRHQIGRVDGSADLLNELDFDGDSLWANQYRSDDLLRIDPECWVVDGIVDLSPLADEARAAAEQADERIDVTNGVAHIPGTDRYLVTGKWWPTIYEVRFIEPEG